MAEGVAEVEQGALALFGGWTGLDMAAIPPDEPLRYVDSNAGRSALAAFTTDDPDREWTAGQVAEHLAVGGRGPVAVGAPDEVAAAVAFLAGPDASYISGVSLLVDGGWSISKDSP